MKTYKVGGCVRDQLMNRVPSDIDYLVIGSTVEEMLSLGFNKVGIDFPVFLHPETGDEYALARTERKSGTGYNGFVCEYSTDVTVEMDLFRRDFRFNSIAYDETTDKYIDPFGGVDDIRNKIIRHTSESFRDDPLRVLRCARFATKFSDFTVSPETIEFMKQMVQSGELNTLTPERVWVETHKALSTDKPSIYFDVLLECGALELLFPEIFDLVGVTQPIQHHPEVDTYIHTKMCVDLAAERGLNIVQRFGALVHDLGKGVTDKALLPSHHGHEKAGVPLVHAMCDRLKIPNEFRWMGAVASEFHLNIHRVKELNHKTLLDKFISMGALNNTNRFYDLLEVCKIDAQGRLGLNDVVYNQIEYAKSAVNLLKAINYTEALDGVPKERIVDTVRKVRLHALNGLEA